MDDRHVPGQGEFKVSGLVGGNAGLDTNSSCALLAFICTRVSTCKENIVDIVKVRHVLQTLCPGFKSQTVHH